MNMIDKECYTSLHTAVKSGHVESARALIDGGAVLMSCPTYCCQSHLHWCSVFFDPCDICTPTKERHRYGIYSMTEPLTVQVSPSTFLQQLTGVNHFLQELQLMKLQKLVGAVFIWQPMKAMLKWQEYY